MRDLARTLGPAGAPARDGQVAWLRSPCLGLCELAPAAMFTIAGETPVRETVAPIDAAGIVARLERAATSASRRVGDLAASRRTAARTARPVPRRSARRPARPCRRPASRSSSSCGASGIVDPTSLDDYLAHRGYLALHQALAMGPRR